MSKVKTNCLAKADRLASGTALIMQYFKNSSESETSDPISPTPDQPVLAEAVPTAVEIRETALIAGIKKLKKLLRLSRQVPVGQNLMRHMAILYFMQFQTYRL